MDQVVLPSNVGLDLLYETLCVNLLKGRYCYVHAPSCPEDISPSYVVVDGERMQSWRGIRAFGPLFCANGSAIGYIAMEEHDDVLIVNEKRIARYPRITRFSISPQGDRIALAANAHHGRFAVIDGSEGPSFPEIWSPRFDPTGKHVTYAARTVDNKAYVFVDSIAYGPVDGFPEEFAVFSPCGNRCAVPVYEEGRWTIYVNGVAGSAYKTLYSTVVFSPDGRHVGHAAGDDQYSGIIVDDQMIVRLHPDASPSLAIGLSDHLAYCASDRDGDYVVRDGKRSATYKGVYRGSLRFSSDGAHLAFIVQKEDGIYAVVDDIELGPYLSIMKQGVVFSRDSSHFAYCAVIQAGEYEKVTMILDGTEVAQFSKLPVGGYPQFLGDDSSAMAGAGFDIPSRALVWVGYDSFACLSNEPQEATSTVGYAKSLVDSASLVQFEYARLWSISKDAATAVAAEVEVIDAIRQLLPTKLYKGNTKDLFVREKRSDPVHGSYVATFASQALIEGMMATLKKTRILDQILVENPDTGETETLEMDLDSPKTQAVITKVLNAIVNAQSLVYGKDYDVANVFVDGKLGDKRLWAARNGETIQGLEFSDRTVQAYLLLKAGASKGAALKALLRSKQSESQGGSHWKAAQE